VDKNAKQLSRKFNYMIEKTKQGTFVYKQFFPTTKQVTHLKTYKKRKMRVLNGPYMEWWDNGEPKVKGQYEDNEKVGIWTEYLIGTNGGYNQGEYTNGEEDGVWKKVDSLGQVLSIKTYRDGELEGPFVAFTAEGDTLKYGTYKEGEVAEEFFAAGKAPSTDDGDTASSTEQMPYLAICDQMNDQEERQKCSNQMLLRSIYSNIKYPAIAREKDIQGTAIVRFVINKEGDVEQVEVLRCFCAEIADECKRVVESLPKWKPGIQRGEAVKVSFNLPIRFKLE